MSLYKKLPGEDPSPPFNQKRLDTITYKLIKTNPFEHTNALHHGLKYHYIQLLVWCLCLYMLCKRTCPNGPSYGLKYLVSCILYDVQVVCKNTTTHETRAPGDTDHSPYYNEHFCIKLDQRDKILTSEWNQQQQQHFIRHASRSSLCIQFVTVAF